MRQINTQMLLSNPPDLYAVFIALIPSYTAEVLCELPVSSQVTAHA